MDQEAECFSVGSDASFQNGPVENAHQYISDGIVCALLFGANLNVEFWPFAFHHYLRPNNSLCKKGQDTSPYQLATGQKDNFAGLKFLDVKFGQGNQDNKKQDSNQMPEMEFS